MSMNQISMEAYQKLQNPDVTSRWVEYISRDEWEEKNFYAFLEAEAKYRNMGKVVDPYLQDDVVVDMLVIYSTDEWIPGSGIHLAPVDLAGAYDTGPITKITTGDWVAAASKNLLTCMTADEVSQFISGISDESLQNFADAPPEKIKLILGISPGKIRELSEELWRLSEEETRMLHPGTPVTSHPWYTRLLGWARGYLTRNSAGDWYDK